VAHDYEQGLSDMGQSASTELLVKVRRQWNDECVASYRLQDISGLHMDNVSGGVQARANRDYLHGYVLCNSMVDGKLSHSCLHGPPPHSIKVCVVQKDNTKAAYTLLRKRMDWEHRLCRCPFAVDLGIAPPDGNAVSDWLNRHCLPDTHHRVGQGWWTAGHGWGVKAAPKGPQIWFADRRQADAFSARFGLTPPCHQNQGKQGVAASFMLSEASVTG
jgi:hypothetical protein